MQTWVRHVRFMNITKTGIGHPRRQLWSWRPRREDPAGAISAEHLGSLCFGAVGECERRALLGIVAGQESLAARTPPQPAARDHSDPLG